nr:MAG TPA: hypothetical protein [Caudoviricetes sp.]
MCGERKPSLKILKLNKLRISKNSFAKRKFKMN